MQRTYRNTTLIVFLLTSLCACVLAQNAELKTGEAIPRELQPGEAHNYSLTLATNQAAQVVVTQKGVDAKVYVYDAANKLVVEMDSPNGTQGDELVWLVNQPAGNYRVEVKPLTARGQGKYEIRLAFQRASTSTDLRNAQAQLAIIEGTRLGNKRDQASQKTAVAKFTEAARLLGSDGDAELQKTLKLNLFAYAPLAAIESMKLVKTPGPVTLYHSADAAKPAQEKRATYESLLNFYQPLLKTKFELNLVVLNKTDWSELCAICPYVAPLFTPDPPVMLQGSNTDAAVQMLGMFKSKMPAALNSALATEGLTYESSVPVTIEMSGYLEVATILRQHAVGSLPKRWMAGVIEAYLVNAWLGEKHPSMQKRIGLVVQIPGAVLTPNTRNLDSMFGAQDMFTTGVAMSRAADLGAALYDKHKLNFLAELQKAFPPNQTTDAATAEQRLYALSPLIKPWVESFGYTGAALEVRQAEDALVTARKAKDANAFDRLVTNDYAGLNQYGQQRNKAGFRQSITQVLPVTVFTLDRTDIEMSGDLGIVRGAQSEQWEGATLQKHLFTRIWVKREGRWQLLSNTQFMEPNQ